MAYRHPDPLYHVLEVAPCENESCHTCKIEGATARDEISEDELAFYIAGAHAMEVSLRRSFNRLGVIGDPRQRLIQACLEAGRPILQLADLAKHVRLTR